MSRYPPGPTDWLFGLPFVARTRRDPLGHLLRMAQTYGEIAHTRVLVLVSVLQEFRLELAAGQGDAEPEPLIALRPKGCVRVTVNRRAPSMALDTSRATT